MTLSHYLAMPAFDALASILIGLVLMLEAAVLGAECRGLIIGEAARPLVINSVRSVASRYDELGPLEELRTLQLGPSSVLLLPPLMGVDELGRVAQRLERDLRQENPSIKHVVFYITPGKA